MFHQTKAFDKNTVITTSRFSLEMPRDGESLTVQGQSGGSRPLAPISGTVFGPDHRDAAACAIGGFTERWPDDQIAMPPSTEESI